VSKLSLLLFLCIHLLAFDVTQVSYSSHKVANGNTLLLEFAPQKEIEYLSVVYQNREFKIYENPKRSEFAYTFVPINYYEKPQNKRFELHYKKSGERKSQTLLFKVVDGAYKKEVLSVSKEKVNPQDPEVKKRITKEYNEAMKIYATSTAKNYIDSAFILPLKSEITSEFGKARTYNGSLKGYHSGTDFRAKVGTPIVAANSGKVVLVQNRFYSGGSVVIDHGRGIYTCYFHMSSFSVNVGDEVQKGEVIGRSGKSGRVTGPHLHFSARIHGVQVDPMQLISLVNRNLLKGNN